MTSRDTKLSRPRASTFLCSALRSFVGVFVRGDDGDEEQLALLVLQQQVLRERARQVAPQPLTSSTVVCTGYGTIGASTPIDARKASNSARSSFRRRRRSRTNLLERLSEIRDQVSGVLQPD